MALNERVRQASIKRLEQEKAQCVAKLLKINKQLANLKPDNHYDISYELKRANK